MSDNTETTQPQELTTEQMTAWAKHEKPVLLMDDYGIRHGVVVDGKTVCLHAGCKCPHHA